MLPWTEGASHDRRRMGKRYRRPDGMSNRKRNGISVKGRRVARTGHGRADRVESLEKGIPPANR
jgi:hypothetical protein